MAVRRIATYDVANREVGAPDFKTGLTGFCSYRRLIDELRKSGSIREDGEVTFLTMTDQGIEIVYK